MRFCPQDSSDHSLTLHSKTGLYINAFSGRALTGQEIVTVRRKKIASGSNTTGGLFNSVPQSMSSKRAKPASGKIMLTLESPLFLFITRVRGPVIFIGRMADILISTVHF